MSYKPLLILIYIILITCFKLVDVHDKIMLKIYKSLKYRSLLDKLLKHTSPSRFNFEDLNTLQLRTKMK